MLKPIRIAFAAAASVAALATAACALTHRGDSELVAGTIGPPSPPGDELVVATSGGRPFADVSNNTLLPGGVGLSDTILNYNRGRQLFLQFEYRFQ